MVRSAKGKKSKVPVIGEKEYAEYIAFLKNEGNPQVGEEKAKRTVADEVGRFDLSKN